VEYEGETPQAAEPPNQHAQQGTPARPFWATPSYSDSIFGQPSGPSAAKPAPDGAALDQEYSNFYEAMGIKK